MTACREHARLKGVNACLEAALTVINGRAVSARRQSGALAAVLHHIEDFKVGVTCAMALLL